MTTDPTSRLRGHGLRPTPQRRAILAAFAGGRTEHLTAEEVGERARHELPELARGTVYNTLGEFVRVGLLSVFGRDEPIRYETNVDGGHQHFRCLGCGRLYDVDEIPVEGLGLGREGFSIERVRVVVEGACPLCVELERAFTGAAEHPDRELVAAARAARLEPQAPGEGAVEIAYARLDSPIGPLLAAASERGLVRLGFDADGGDRALEELARGSATAVVEAPERLEPVGRQLDEYFAGRRRDFELPLDLALAPARRREALETAQRTPYGKVSTYRDVTAEGSSAEASREAGRALGANPIPIVLPCHRVVRADGGLGAYTGGVERKRFLLRLEGALR